MFNKRSLSVTFVIFLFLAASTTIANPKNSSESWKSRIVENLTIGIKSENDGLRISSASILGKLIDQKVLKESETGQALIPLYKMLSTGKSEEERIVAALSLFKTGDEIGIHKLRGSALFDESEKVRKVCKNLYYTFHEQNGTMYLYDL